MSERGAQARRQEAAQAMLLTQLPAFPHVQGTRCRELGRAIGPSRWHCTAAALRDGHGDLARVGWLRLQPDGSGDMVQHCHS